MAKNLVEKDFTSPRSLQSRKQAPTKSKGLAESLIGIAKTDAPPPTDKEVKAALDERLQKRYL